MTSQSTAPKQRREFADGRGRLEPVDQIEQLPRHFDQAAIYFSGMADE